MMNLIPDLGPGHAREVSEEREEREVSEEREEMTVRYAVPPVPSLSSPCWKH